jgi:hypothetical protein
VTKTTGELLDEIADGLMIYGSCNDYDGEGRCWENGDLICRVCFETGWQSMFQSAARSDYEESNFKSTKRIERLLRSFANQQIIRTKVQPNLDRQKFVDHYTQKLIEAYEFKMRNDFKCELADKPISSDW